MRTIMTGIGAEQDQARKGIRGIRANLQRGSATRSEA